MTVECPSCKTIFPVDPRKVPAGGVHARCSSCSQVFFVAEEWTSDASESQEPSSQNLEPEPGDPGVAVGIAPRTEMETEGEGPHSVPPGLDPSPGPLFGRRDPVEKAQRLARVLVSDIILYNPDRHRTALDGGRVREEFEEEIQKSWIEYVEQVGEEIAATTTFFDDALNEILAVSDGTS